MKGKKAVLIALIALVPIAACLTECLNKRQPVDARGEVYAGSAACMKCHKDVYSSFIHTAHFQTSRPANLQSIHGSFAAGKNVFDFASNQKVVMERRDSGLYQCGYINGKLTESQRFDIVIGGIKAETYLYWKGKSLYELPISYFNALQSWTNGPGYATDMINFGRPIVTRCLECHSSYINELPQRTLRREAPEFDQNSLIYGIDCERCHGPGANHVNFHTENPDAKKAMYMVSYKTLSREQKLNTCAVCHSGNREKLERSAFDFKPGDTLSKFKVHDYFLQKVDSSTLDVHGNQNGLLSASKCFLMSNMDCLTCHNTHVNERGNLALYSQRCMNCHNTANHNVCKLHSPQLSAGMKNNCIDCHMPASPSSVITVQTASEKNAIPYLVRTHRIAIYPLELKKIQSLINRAN
jgi:hypothetical protein